MTAPLPDVYLVAARAAVALLNNGMTPEFVASRTWFHAALDASEAFRHPLPPAPIDHTQVRVLSPSRGCPLCSDDLVSVTK